MEKNTQDTNIENEVVEATPEVVEVTPETVENSVEEATQKATASVFIEKAKNNAICVFTKVKDFCVELFEKIKADPKGLGVKLGAILLGAIIVIVGLSVGINAVTNNYKTPIKVMQKYDNSKKYYDSFDKQLDLLNGFCEDEYEDLVKLMKSSEEYDEDEIADAKEDFQDEIEDMKEEYGKNYKYTYKIIEKEELDKDDLREYRDELRDYADSLESQLEIVEEYDSDDWEDIADDLGLSKSKAKKYYSILEDIRKVYKKAKVSAGYDLTVEVTLTGSELEEPETDEIDITVLKVDGRWISEDAF